MSMQSATKRTTLREAWYGPEKQCSACGEWWPADPEFFGVTGGYLRSFCKACRYEQEARQRESKRRAIP